MAYSQIFQAALPVMREKLRKSVTEMTAQAGKPMDLTDEVLNDIACAFMALTLSGESVPIAFATACQILYGIQNEE